jgi:hypothetical protein
MVYSECFGRGGEGGKCPKETFENGRGPRISTISASLSVSLSSRTCSTVSEAITSARHYKSRNEPT